MYPRCAAHAPGTPPWPNLMVRIFPWLALGNVLVLVATAGLGLWGEPPPGNRHVALAVFTLLLSCLVQVSAFIYFIVSGKLLGQAVHIGHLVITPLLEAKRLKRLMVRFMALVLASVVLATATGAARWSAGNEGTLHLIAAMFTFVAHGWALYRQHDLIFRNSMLLENVLREYSKWRMTRQGPESKLRP